MSDRSQELAQRITRAGAQIEPRLSDHDLERLMAATGQRARRRVVRRVGFAVAALGVAALAFLIARRGGNVDGRDGVAGGPASPGAIRFSDGSLATPLDRGSVLVVAEDSPRRMRVDLQLGGARFQVTRNRERSFSVGAGSVAITVVGTVFAVQRLPDRVGVTVEQGTVKVAWKAGEHLLHGGEDGWFPIDAPAADSGGGPASGNGADGGGAREAARGRPRGVRAPAAGKGADDARVDAGPAEDPVETLLKAADAARAAGHPDEGAAILKRLLDRHPQDPRAPLAQLTLGRALLMELGRPHEAAVVFAELRARAPSGPFAADALAREAEAWSRAGRREEARARALEYLRLYPDGNRAAAVRGFGGIE